MKYLLKLFRAFRIRRRIRVVEELIGLGYHHPAWEVEKLIYGNNLAFPYDGREDELAKLVKK